MGGETDVSSKKRGRQSSSADRREQEGDPGREAQGIYLLCLSCPIIIKCDGQEVFENCG